MHHTITKTYSNLKAAHRQWRHHGHCSKVHGENWTFRITFGCKALDYMQFVVDFGELREVYGHMMDMFDHTLLIDQDDPKVEFFKQMKAEGLANVVFVPNANAEGLAKLVYEMADTLMTKRHAGRVHVVKVECCEDEKNTATYSR